MSKPLVKRTPSGVMFDYGDEAAIAEKLLEYEEMHRTGVFLYPSDVKAVLNSIEEALRQPAFSSLHIMAIKTMILSKLPLAKKE